MKTIIIKKPVFDFRNQTFYGHRDLLFKSYYFIVERVTSWFITRFDFYGYPKDKKCCVCDKYIKWYKMAYSFDVIKQRADDIPFESLYKNFYGAGTYLTCSKPCKEIFTWAVI